MREERCLLQGVSEAEVKYASFSADGQLVFLTRSNGHAEVFGSGGPLLYTLQHHTEPVYMAASCPSSTFLALACEDGEATVWDLKGGKHVMTLKHLDAITWISFSCCGQLLLTASWDGTAKVWSDTGECLQTFEEHAAPVIYAEFGTLQA